MSMFVLFFRIFWPIRKFGFFFKNGGGGGGGGQTLHKAVKAYIEAVKQETTIGDKFTSATAPIITAKKCMSGIGFVSLGGLFQFGLDKKIT